MRRAPAAIVPGSRAAIIVTGSPPCGHRLATPRGSLAAMRGPLAYLDPGSGSMILQVVAGGAAAVAVAGRLFWRRILILLRIKKRDETP
jgi:hypothetical protein